MRNKHRNRRVAGLVRDIIADPRLSPRQQADYILQMLDVLDVIIDGSSPEAAPAARSTVSLLTKIPAVTTAAIYKDLLARGIIFRCKDRTPHAGKHAETYISAAFPRRQQRAKAQSDLVIDLGSMESLQWDILEDVYNADLGFMKQTEAKRKYHRKRDPSGRMYGCAGVMAHIDALAMFGHVRRVTGTEALRMLGCTNLRGAGRRPILLVRGEHHLDPRARARAKPWPHPSLTPDRAGLLAVAALPSVAARATKEKVHAAFASAKPRLTGDVVDREDAAADEEPPVQEYPMQAASSGHRKPILVDENGQRIPDDEVEPQPETPVRSDNQPGPDEV